MDAEQWSAAASVVAALEITVASFRQWVIVTVDGDLLLRRWAKWMLVSVVVLLVASLALPAWSILST